MLNIFKRTYSPKERSIFRFLRKNMLFRELTDDELAEFLPFMHLRSYKDSEAVFFRSDPSQALYLIKEGRITISIDIEGRFEELYTSSVPSFFGENALLPKKQRLYHATCSSDTAELYVIPHLNIIEVFEDRPAVRGKMMAALAEYQGQLQANLFKAYQSSFGFFDLAQIFR